MRPSIRSRLRCDATHAFARALMAASLASMAACYSSSHRVDSGPIDAAVDLARDLDVDADELGIDGPDLSARDEGVDAASCAAVPADPPGTPCPGAMELRGAPFGTFPFDPRGPLEGMYVSGLSSLPTGNTLKRVAFDLAAELDSVELEGVPAGYNAGGPEAIIGTSGLLGITVGVIDGDRKFAFYDSAGRLAAPMTGIGRTFWPTTVEAGCAEALLFMASESGLCGTNVEGLRVAVDGTITARTGVANLPNARAGASTFWRGDRWTLFAIPTCASTVRPYLIDLFLDGTLGPPREIAIDAYGGGRGYTVNAAPTGPWSVMLFDVATEALSYARFDPDSGEVVTPQSVVYPRTAGSLDSQIRGAREAGGVDGYLLLKTFHTTDSRVVLLRIRPDGTVLQDSEIERSGFHPPLIYFRWLGDRYALTLPTGTDVLQCAP